jgi:hypothetical protein
MPHQRPKRQERAANKLHGRERPGSTRTSYACGACKQRKTKVRIFPSPSNLCPLPGPCIACESRNSRCHFSPKLDSRRKDSFKHSLVHELQRFFLLALLRMLKHADNTDLATLLELIRDPDRPEKLARFLTQRFSHLKDQGLVPLFDFDEAQALTFIVQSLFDPVASPSSSNVVIEKSNSRHDQPQISEERPVSIEYQSGSNSVSSLATRSSGSQNWSNGPPTPASNSFEWYYSGPSGFDWGHHAVNPPIPGFINEHSHNNQSSLTSEGIQYIYHIQNSQGYQGSETHRSLPTRDRPTALRSRDMREQFEEMIQKIESRSQSQPPPPPPPPPPLKPEFFWNNMPSIVHHNGPAMPEPLFDYARYYERAGI